MYGSYSRFATQQSAESTRKVIESVLAARAAEIVNAIRRNGGRLTQAQIEGQFGADALAFAVEHARTIYPVSVDTRQGLATFYEAN